MRFFIFLFITLAVGSVQAQQSCADLFKIRYFEKSAENYNAEKLMELYAWHRAASPSAQVNIEKQIIRIYYKWKTDIGTPEGEALPVRALFMIPKYFAESFWEATPELEKSEEARVTFIAQSERDKLQIEMTPQGLVYSVSREPVVGVLSGDFVISLDKKIYLHHNQSSKPYAEFYKHTSILLSAPVLFAGELKVDSQGNVLFLSNESGHYRPTKKHFRWAKRFLAEMGFQLPVPTDQGSDPASSQDLL